MGALLYDSTCDTLFKVLSFAMKPSKIGLLDCLNLRNGEAVFVSPDRLSVPKLRNLREFFSGKDLSGVVSAYTDRVASESFDFHGLDGYSEARSRLDEYLDVASHSIDA